MNTLIKMTDKNSHKTTMRLMICALLMAGCTTFGSHKTPPEGTWVCKTEWSCEQAGIPVSCSAEQQSTCTDNVMSSAGVVSIGTAQWSEKKEGTCYASGEELYGTWTSVQTAPKNDAARQFERETLKGKSLAIVSKAVEQEYRVRVTSRTDTQFKAVNAKGQVISCTRL
jgi:hypothetical protein